MEAQVLASDLQEGDVLAAVDLGSNSFHMVIARYELGRLHIIDKLRESIRLGAGLDADNYLVDETMQRALACLKRFGERLSDSEAKNVRIVGTNTLRRARNSDEFIRLARTALGHDIEIVAGREEARLIYSGVDHFSPHYPGNRLVMDIGGGSTEIIYGEKESPQLMESVSVGCVYLSELYFADGKLNAKRMQKAITHAELELEPIYLQFTEKHWDYVIGASGTARAAINLVRTMGWSNDALTPESLDKLKVHLEDYGSLDNISLPGLSEDRARILPAGIAIMVAFFKLFQVKEMYYTDGALREGLLYDYLDRLENRDIRYLTIKALCEQYKTDTAQSARVANTALDFLEQVRTEWTLDGGRFERLLQWGSELYEVGLSLSHSQYHKHSNYLIANADMAGFSKGGQAVIAHLIGHHRRKFPERHDFPLSLDTRKQFYSLIIFRLACLLHRSRLARDLPSIRLEPHPNQLDFHIPKTWLDEHPLTYADLLKEQEYLTEKLFKLQLIIEE